MGLLPELLDIGYAVQEMRLVDRHGKWSGGFSADVFMRLTDGRFVSIPRSELSAALNRSVADKAELIFGDQIASLDDDDGSAVAVGFDKGAPRCFDMVIGAEGIHSPTRAIIFGPPEQFEYYLGYKFAAFITPRYGPRDPDVYMSYSEPGKQIARFSLRDGSTLVLLIYYEAGDGTIPEGAAVQKA